MTIMTDRREAPNVANVNALLGLATRESLREDDGHPAVAQPRRHRCIRSFDMRPWHASGRSWASTAEEKTARDVVAVSDIGPLVKEKR